LIKAINDIFHRVCHGEFGNKEKLQTQHFSPSINNKMKQLSLNLHQVPGCWQ